MIHCIRKLLMPLAMGATLPVFAQPTGQTDAWTFVLEPYLLASSIEGDTSLGRVTGADVEVEFDDILESLDVGAMVHFEAIKDNRWGIILDYGFMDLSSAGALALGGILEADVRQGVLEAFVMRRFKRDSGYLDFYAGLRWWDNDVGASVDAALLPGIAKFGLEQDWVDPVIGVRWHHTISDRWKMAWRGDVGGFGVESDFSAAAGLSAIYRFKPGVLMELGYRATWVDFATGTPLTPGYFVYDTVTHGPLVGVMFEF